MYSCDSQGTVISYNQAAVKLWGRAPQKHKDLWTGAWKLFTSDGQLMPHAESPMARTIHQGMAMESQEIIIQRPDLTKVVVSSCPILFFDDTGQIKFAVDTLINITRPAEDERQQAMLAAIVDTSDDAIISKTLQGNITSWNKAAESMFGYTADEVIGKHISILIPRDRLPEENIIIGEITRGNRVHHFETLRVTKSGRQIPLSLSISPIKDNRGKIIGASKIARDISAEVLARENSARYTQNLEIINSIGKAISEELELNAIVQKVTDITTRITGAKFGAFFYNTVNEHGEALTLYALSGAPKEAFERFGMPRNTAVFHPTFSGEGVLRIDDVTKDPRYGKNVPHNGMPEGHLPVVSFLSVPVISKSGSVIGGLFFGHPEAGKFTKEHEILVLAIASQAAIGIDNAELYQEVKQLNERKNEFIGLASHELKTPLTSISASLQILDRMAMDETGKKFLRKTMHQVNRLTSLVSDLLDISKIEAGRLDLLKEPFDMKEMLEDSIELIQQSQSTHSIHLSAEDGVIINADRQRIEQAIINLLTNAIKYSPSAKRVDVSLSNTEKEVKVGVSDRGIGIPHDKVNHIFSRFYRVEGLRPHMSGLGIGLYLVKEIVERHQGWLWVDSELGKGSTFWFTLPLRPKEIRKQDDRVNTEDN